MSLFKGSSQILSFRFFFPEFVMQFRNFSIFFLKDLFGVGFDIIDGLGKHKFLIFRFSLNQDQLLL